MSGGSFIGENIVLFSFLLLMTIVLATLIDKLGISWMPPSGASMIFGFCVGGFVHLLSRAESDFLLFKADFFFYALLPPIIFEAGYNMKRTNFFKNISSILLFAIFGTIISTFVVGLGLYALANMGAVNISPDDILDPLTFGALISSIDPIATLAILGNKQLKCDQLLYSLVFGESVLNDAVAITLYNTFRGFRSSAGFGVGDLFGAVAKFAAVSIFSVFIGAAFALVLAFILRRVNFTKNPSNEFVMILFFAYTCYAVAELTHMSGIMALFVCGVMMAHYAWYNISSVTRTTSRHAFHSIAHMAEAFLFVYFGISAFFSTLSHYEFEWSYSLILWSIVLCVIGRAANIFPLAALANTGRKKKISMKMQVVMWFSGLRGAISFALAMNMNSPVAGSARFVTTTMVIIVLTTLGLGGSSTWVLRKLGMLNVVDEDEAAAAEAAHWPTGTTFVYAGSNVNETGENQPRFINVNETGEMTRQRTLSTIVREAEVNHAEEQAQMRSSCLRRMNLHRFWTRFDAAYMQPWFGGRHAPKIEDHSAEHSHDGDNSQMPNPYLPDVFAGSRAKEDAEERRYLDGVVSPPPEHQEPDDGSLDALGANIPDSDGSSFQQRANLMQPGGTRHGGVDVDNEMHQGFANTPAH